MRRLRAEWPVLLLGLLPLIQYWPATSGRVLLGPGDGILMFLPLRVFAAQAWQAFELPLWNPWVFSGFPLLAAMTAGAFFPFNAPYLFVAPPLAMNVVALAMLSSLAVGTYAYARAIGCTRAGALLAGVGFVGCGFTVARIGNTPLIQAAPALPWLLFACERLRATGGVRWVAFGAAATAMALFAGHPQVPAYTMAIAAAYVAWRAIAAPPIGRLRYLGLGAAMLAAGVALALPQLLPSAELAGQSVRARLSFADFVDLALTPPQLAELFFPLLSRTLFTDMLDTRANAIFEQAGYTGLLGLGLALAALAAWRRDAVAAFWALLALLALLLALGAATPVAWLAYHVPVLNLFRISARYLFVFDFAVALLAGIGLSRLQRGDGRRAVRLVAVGLAILLPAVALVWLQDGARLWDAAARTGGTAPAGLTRLGPAIVLPLLLGAATVVVLALLAARRRPAPAVVALALLLQGGDLYLYALQLCGPYPRVDAALVQPASVAPLRAVAGDGRAALTVAAGVAPADYRLALWGQRLIAGYDSLLIARYGAFAGDMDYAGRVDASALVEHPLFLDLLSTRALAVSFLRDPAAPIEAGGARFAGPEIGVTLQPGAALDFPLPTSAHVTGVGAITFLGGAVGVGDGAPALRVTLRDAAGATRVVELLAGVHTAEWAWDRADVAPVVRHRRAPVAETFDMGGTPANKYVGVVALDAPLDAEWVRLENVAPQSQLQVSRVSLLDAEAERVHALSLAHRLLDQPERWRRRGGVNVPNVLRAASPLAGAAWLGPPLGVAPVRADPPHDAARVEILENRLALPHAWLVPRTIAVDAAAALASVRQARLPDGAPFDPRAVALVEAAASQDFGALDPAAGAEVTSATAERLEVATRSAAPAFLVLSEIDYPGWQVTVDGAPAALVRANAMLRGVALPAGAHRVVFVYRSRGVMLGFAGAGLTALALAVAAGWRWRVRRAPGGRG
ncbi:MAG: YfhO family protein [Deltaproteobacteria bacterium]|nr:YfhO family protein [Deltaproteobacteria bacterium]